MRKVFLVLMLGLSMGLYACGGDDNGGGGSASDPTTADFANPSGTLTEDNADDVGNEALNNFNGSNGVGLGFLRSNTNGLLAHKANASSCFSNASETGGTIDYECLSNNNLLGGCTGSGSLTFDIEDTVYSYTYDDVSISCNNSYSFESINGTYNYDTSSMVYCMNITVENADGYSYSANGCSNPDGDFLVTVDGETYVIGNGMLDCDGASVSVTDSTGEQTIMCDVEAEEGETCSDAEDVVSVSNCSIN